MAQSIQLPVTQVGLEASINAAMKRVGSSTKINLGTNSKQISALSQPLGRITGQADEFSKSMAAANARVLAFGASAGIIAGVSTAMGALLMNTIKVEKSLIEIGSVLNKSGSELDKYGQDIFNVAKNTGQSFDIVAEGALELARQGLDAEKTLKRLNDALILSRLSGLDAKQSVEGLTAAFNSFESSGETSATILNKLVAVSQKYAVSERDLIEAIKRSASVADLAGVSFDELAALTTAVQQKTARGGAVIGNSFKTIFARIQDKGVLEDLDDLGIKVIGASGKVLSATDVLKNLAGEFEGFSKIKQADIAQKLGGVYQLDKLLAALKDLGAESSVFGGALKEALEAGNKAYEKNAVLNQSLDSLINRTTLSAQELGATLGKIGITDSLKNVLGFFNSLIEGIQKILGEESALGGLVKGLVKGIGAIFAGPGLVLFGAIILKLSKDLVQFGFGSLKIFFGIGKAAKEVQNVEGAISQILARNVDLQQKLFGLENNRAGQLRVITAALIEQEAVLRRSAAISSGLAAPLYNVGARAEDSGLRIQPPRAAAGYVPATAIEKKDIQMGVGGAKSGDKPVTIPNFNFGGGKKGSIVANTGEYVVPNFAGSGGSAIFNRDMVRSMGLPEGAKKINAAGGFIPNFAKAKVPPIGAPIGEFVDYFGGQKESDTYAAIKRLPEYLESQKDPKLIGTKFNEKFVDANRIAGAIKKSITRAPFEVDANSIPFTNGNGLGVVTLNKATEASYGKIKLKDEDLAKIGGRELVEGGFFEKKFLNTLKQEGVDPNQVSQFREEFKQKNIKLGSEGDELNNELRLNNIRVSDFSRLQGYGKEKQEQFQKRINTIFAGPLAQLTKEVFGGALGNVDESMMTDKYLFGTDVLGNIYESAINLYTKGAANLPSFKEGEAKRSASFDFPLNDADQAKRLNDMFFPGSPVGRADAKYTAGTSDLQDIVSKSLNDPDALEGIRRQIKSKGSINAAKGFIPNFASIYDKFKVDPKAQGSLKVNNEKSTPFTAKKNIWDFVDNPEAKRKLLALSDSFDTTIGQNDFWFRGTNIKELKNLLSQGYSSSTGINDQTNSGSTFFASSFGKAASYGLRGPTGDKVDNGIVMILKKQFLQNKQFDQSPFEQEKENSIRLFGKYFKEDLEGVVDLRSGNFTGIDKLGIKNSAKGFIPNFASINQTGLLGFNKDTNLSAYQKEQIQKSVSFPRITAQYAKDPNTNFLGRGAENAAFLSKGMAFKFPTLAYTNRAGLKTKLQATKDMNWDSAAKQLAALQPNLKIIPNAVKGVVTSQPFAGKTIGKTIEDGLKANDLVTLIRRNFAQAQQNNTSKPNWLEPLYVDGGSYDNFTFPENINEEKINDPRTSANDIFNNNKIGLIDLGIFGSSAKQARKEEQAMAKTTAASGYVPNFADPLKEAVGREMAAGVPASQIYVDKNSSLKNAMNPMGLMVANRRDEPAGGFQGINRARREGANPMMYGAAGGFIPNYAPFDITGTPLSGNKGQAVSFAKINKSINDFAKSLDLAAIDLSIASEAKALKDQIRKLTEVSKLEKGSKEAVAKAGLDYIKAKKAEVMSAGKAGEMSSAAGAARLLESNAGKKLAKQLDKVYLEYNKSQKTKQDLTNAEAKAAAILQKTSLKAGSQRAIVASTGSLASTRTSAQTRAGGDRDMLGAIFGLQAAFSGLTGATQGLENGFFQALNSVSAAASTATTSLFAVQGLSQAFGGAETKIGGFLGKLGPYAAGIGFLYTGFNELTKYLDKNNVEVQKASESMLMVSEAASKAAINLSTLNPIQQERVRKRAEDVIEKSRTLEASTSGYNPYGVGSSVPTTRLATFEGVSDELKTGFEKIISESLAAGVSETELDKLITSKFQSGGKLTSQEVQDISKELNIRLSGIVEKGSPESIIKGLSEERKNVYSQMSAKDVETAISERGKGANELSPLQDAFYNAGIEGDIARQESIRKTTQLLRERAGVEKKAEEEAVKQTGVAIAQDKLKNALAMAIAKARSFENDQLGQTLLSAQELGNLDEKGLRNIQDRIALREIDRKLADETSSIIQSQIDKAKEITANSEKALALEAKFQGLTEEDLRNPEKLKEILGETNALLSQGVDLTKAEAGALEIKINALIENNQLEKDSLKLNQQKTEEFKEQAKQLDLISQASKRALEAQSFDREIGTTKSINAGDLQVRALESSKLGASDSQIRQIDQQIAAIKENTVALEQANAREKVFSEFKGQLLENNKITDKAVKADIDNQIRQADTVEKLEDLAFILTASMQGVDGDSAISIMSGVLQKFRQDLAQQDESAKQAKALAAGETADAGRIAPVISALEMFRRSLLQTTQIIDQKIEDIKLQQLTSISGRELIQGNYDAQTLEMQRGQTETEAARIARERQNKSVSQLFNEEFGKTEEERALDVKKTIVDASVQFKNNMIEGIMGAVEGTSSLKDGLRSAAYEFVKAINQKMINNLIDKVVGGSVQSGSGQTGGGLVGFLSGMFGMASGGMINGGSGMKDDVPAMLMGGEYVVNKKAVSKYGAQFLESLNNGTLMGYAKGGSVQKGPQGNFYTPGTFGQGAISGKRNLLDFATQTGTSGQFDQMINESGYQSVSLEPESSRLSVSGMRNSPMFEATQSAKGQAFDLYLQQYNAEREAKKAEKEQKSAFKKQLIMLAASAAASGIGNVAMTGGKAAVGSLGAGASFFDKVKAFGSGAVYGGNVAGTGQMAGGLKNLFSGNFSTAFRSGVPLMAGSVDSAKQSGYGKGATMFSYGAMLPNLNEAIDPQALKEALEYQNLLIGEKYAIGGMIPSTSGIDTVPAMLSGGEFVMNRSAVQGIGAPNLQSMNSGGTSITSEETSKELNEKLLAKLDELINSSGSTGSITINVAPSGQTTQETSQDPSAGRQQLARQIKDAVLQIINDEKRIGGTLRR
jgi:TP901 family phage tail tape measure protein